MKKIILPLILISGFTLAQKTGSVGVNTDTPAATLDVVGTATDINQLDGVIAPRITGDQLSAKTYTNVQTGALIYVTSPASTPSGQVVNVTAPGYYYFDGSIWQASAGNDWHTTGNAKTNATSNFLGTTDDTDLIFKRNNVIAGTLRSVNTSFGAYALASDTNNGENSAFGVAALYANTTGRENTAVGIDALYSNTTGVGNAAVGVSVLQNLTAGGQNTAIGNYSGEKLGIAGGSLPSNSWNTFVGSNSGTFFKSGWWNIAIGAGAGVRKNNNLGTGNNNIFIGVSAGAATNGDNNVFIGGEAGYPSGTGVQQTVSNKLVIHSSFTKHDYSDTSFGLVSNPDTLHTGLILGDFVERWVKFNGTFSINPTYAASDATYTKNVVAKPDGTFGFEDKASISVPAPPATGTYVLQSINGVTQWVAQ